MKNYEKLLRLAIQGSPTRIELTPGLTDYREGKGYSPQPGAVIEFVEDGENLFTLVLCLQDMDSLVDMLADTIGAQKATFYEKTCDICDRFFPRSSIDPAFHGLNGWLCIDCFEAREETAQRVKKAQEGGSK